MLFITTILGSLLLSLLTNTDIMGDCLTVVFFYAIYKQGKLVNKLGIDKIEIEASELKATQGKMLKRSLLESLLAAVLTVVVSLIIWRLNIPQSNAKIDPKMFFLFVTPITTIIISSFVFIFCFFANRKKIIIVED